jgi:dienelactone hydrolase
MKVYLYRPLDAGPEPQVVVYFPGSGVLRTTDPLEEIPWLGEDFNFLMATGRAVALPVFLGSMDRSDGFRYRMQDATHAYRDHVIAWGKELGRTLDYLETRDDIDTSSFGYYGFSWGARMGAIMLALHPRLTAAVLHSGGLSPIPVQPEADPFNYLSRVGQPVLMLNSKFDNVYPIETAVRPYFEGLGSAEKDLKETTGGHFIARNTLVRETLSWFDHYLGR